MRNGSGTYNLYTPGNPVSNGTTIDASWANNTLSDIATALTQSIAADGQTPITANIPMANHKITGLAAGTTSGDALSYGQAIAGTTGTFSGAVSGTTGTFTGDVSGANATFSGVINAKGASLVVYKTASTARSATTVYADDPHLVLALTAGTWQISCWLPFWGTTSGAGGLKAKLVYTGTLTSGLYSQNGLVNGAASSGIVGDISTGSVIANTAPISVDTQAHDWIMSTGYVTVSNSGNLTLQWAQNTSNANATNVSIGAWLKATKMA